jgi:predicted TIM-barrel enzyme
MGYGKEVEMVRQAAELDSNVFPVFAPISPEVVRPICATRISAPAFVIASASSTGMGYGKEVEMVRQAAELDILTTPYVFNVEEAEAMTKAGADILVAHMGLTTSYPTQPPAAPSPPLYHTPSQSPPG